MDCLRNERRVVDMTGCDLASEWMDGCTILACKAGLRPFVGRLPEPRRYADGLSTQLPPIITQTLPRVKYREASATRKIVFHTLASSATWRDTAWTMSGCRGLVQDAFRSRLVTYPSQHADSDGHIPLHFFNILAMPSDYLGSVKNSSDVPSSAQGRLSFFAPLRRFPVLDEMPRAGPGEFHVFR